MQSQQEYLLRGQQILVTRDASQSGSLKESLEALGAKVVVIPTIQICDPPSLRAFDQAATKLASFQWLLFTSINAVTKTKARLDKLGINLLDFDHIKIASVGNKTEAEVLAQGWPSHLTPESHYQQEGLLKALIKENVNQSRIWFPRAAKARNFLVDEVTRAGAQVELTPVYDNQMPMEQAPKLKKALLGKTLDWVTFTSSSTFENFITMIGEDFPKEALPKLASIGVTTTKCMQHNSLPPHFTADPQNLDGLIQGLIEHSS